ncbi:unnamed protein product [Nezara viridula]|uniref:Uncharacterized protein n=1 Tax=Nezara viridula TaxID=85310 RepID=A0A9P0E675_NEZVI|nr:unnamed protein product [Nezara viridula]
MCCGFSPEAKKEEDWYCGSLPRRLSSSCRTTRGWSVPAWGRWLAQSPSILGVKATPTLVANHPVKCRLSAQRRLSALSSASTSCVRVANKQFEENSS